MSHEPTDEEWRPAVKAMETHLGRKLYLFDHATSGLSAALAAANSLRDRRIRNEALEEAALRVEPYRSYTQFRDGTVVEDPLTSSIEKMRAELAAIIRALKDKTDEPEASR